MPLRPFQIFHDGVIIRALKDHLGNLHSVSIVFVVRAVTWDGPPLSIENVPDHLCPNANCLFLNGHGGNAASARRMGRALAKPIICRAYDGRSPKRYQICGSRAIGSSVTRWVSLRSTHPTELKSALRAYVVGRPGGNAGVSKRMAASSGLLCSTRWADGIGRVAGSTITFAPIFTRS